MIGLVLIVIFGLIFGYFSTQNTGSVTLNFWQYSWHNVPIYLVVLVSLATGLVLAAVIGILKSWGAKFKIGKKESELKKAEEEKTELTKRVHKLELENTKYKTELGEGDSDENAI